MKLLKDETAVVKILISSAWKPMVLYMAANSLMYDTVPSFPVGVLFATVSFYILKAHFDGLVKDISNAYETAKAGRKT